MKAGSRGSSILGSILLLALAGSAAVSFEPFFSTPSDQEQFAASSLALVEDASTPTQTSAGQETATQSDSLAPGTVVDFRDQVYSVYYSCRQETKEKSKVDELTQTCQPGFLYTIYESDGVISVSPSPGPQGNVACPSNTPTRAGSCSNPASPNPVLSCWSGQPSSGVVYYAIGNEKPQFAGNCASGQKLDVAGNRLTGLSKTLDAADPEKQSAIMATADISPTQQATLMNAFNNIQSGEQKVEEISAERNDIEQQITAYANCTNPANPCTTELQALQTRRDEILREQRIAESELDSLQNNAQRLLAGEPPVSTSGTTNFPGYDLPSRLDFARNTTGFNGSGFIGSPEAQPSSRPIVASPPQTPNPTGEIDWGKFYNQGSSYRPTPQPTGSESTAGTGAQPFQGPQFTPSSYTPPGISGPNRLTDEELAQFPPEIQQAAQKQCELGRCALMHRIAGSDATSAQEKAGQVTQVALIGSPSCSQVSISDCFKAADLPYTLEGRKQVCGALGLDYCDSVGSAKTNVRMAEDVKRFSQTGTVTEVTQTRTVTIDSRGSILGEEITEKSTESQVIAPSYQEGATLRDLEAFYDRAQETQNGVETVYKVTGDVCGVVGTSSSDQTCSYYRRLADAQGGVLSKDQLPSYTRQQLTAVETAGKAIQTPFPTAGTVSDVAPRTAGGTLEAENLAPLFDAERVRNAETARLEGLATYYKEQQQERIIETTSSRLQGLADFTEAQQVARANEASIQRWEGMAAYAEAQREARARSNDAASARLQGQADFIARTNYLENHPTTQNMYDALIAAGQTPAETQQYIDKVVSTGAWNTGTEAQVDSYLAHNYDRIVEYGKERTALGEALLGKIVASGPPPPVSDIQVTSAPLVPIPGSTESLSTRDLINQIVTGGSQAPSAANELWDRATTRPAWLDPAIKPAADLVSDLTGKDQVLFGVQGQQSQATDEGVLTIDTGIRRDFSIADPDLTTSELSRILQEREFVQTVPSGSSIFQTSLPVTPSAAKLIPSTLPSPTLTDIDYDATFSRAVQTYGADSIEVLGVQSLLSNPDLRDVNELEARLQVYDLAPVPSQEFLGTDRSIPIPSSGYVPVESSIGCWSPNVDCGLMNRMPAEGQTVVFTPSDGGGTEYSYYTPPTGVMSALNPSSWFTQTGTVSQTLLPAGASTVTVTNDGGVLSVRVGGSSSVRGVYSSQSATSATYGQILSGLSGQPLRITAPGQ
ncbi:hypothetical protein C4556_02410 [Candidatus Parcubacteria bacterium]|nr:MAG: hypothetical protein C4556_02410 [Candidatus Parcubacteria bacterium]